VHSREPPRRQWGEGAGRGGSQAQDWAKPPSNTWCSARLRIPRPRRNH